MPQKQISRDDVIAMLRRLQGERTNKALADDLGVHASYISEIYKGTRNPGPSMLRKLGLTAETTIVTVYRKIA